MPDITQNIAKRREYLQITQQELAELANVSVRLIRELEAGRANPGLRQLTQVLNALGLDLAVVEKKQ